MVGELSGVDVDSFRRSMDDPGTRGLVAITLKISEWLFIFSTCERETTTIKAMMMREEKILVSITMNTLGDDGVSMFTKLGFSRLRSHTRTKSNRSLRENERLMRKLN